MCALYNKIMSYKHWENKSVDVVLYLDQGVNFSEDSDQSYQFKELFINPFLGSETAAVAQLVRALALQAECWVYESQPRQTQVHKNR